MKTAALPHFSQQRYSTDAKFNPVAKELFSLKPSMFDQYLAKKSQFKLRLKGKEVPLLKKNVMQHYSRLYYFSNSFSSNYSIHSNWPALRRSLYKEMLSLAEQSQDTKKIVEFSLDIIQRGGLRDIPEIEQR